MLEVWLCISITGAQVMRLLWRASTEVKLVAKSRLVKQRYGRGQATLFINRHQYDLLSWATVPFHHIHLKFYLTGPLGLYVNRSTDAKDSPNCYCMSISILAHFFSCLFFFFHVQLAPVFGLWIPKKIIRWKHKKSEQWWFVTWKWINMKQRQKRNWTFLRDKQHTENTLCVLSQTESCQIFSN